MNINSAGGSSSPSVEQKNSRTGWNEFPPAIQKVIAEKVKENNDQAFVKLGLAFLPEHFLSSTAQLNHGEIYDTLINNKNLPPVLLYQVLTSLISIKGLDISEAALHFPEEIKKEELPIIKRRVYFSIPILETNTLVNKLREVRQIEKSLLHGGEECVIREMGQIVKELVRRVQPFTSEEQCTRVLNVLQSNWASIFEKSDRREIVKELVSRIWFFPSDTLRFRVLNVLQSNWDAIPGKSERREIAKELVSHIWFFQTDKLRFRVLDVLKSNKDVMPGSGVGEILATRVREQSFISEALWTRILDVTPGNEVGKIVARLVQQTPLSDPLRFRVLKVLKNNKNAVSGKEMEKIVAKLVQQTPPTSKALWTRILDVIPSSEMGKMVAKLVQQTSPIPEALWIRILGVIPSSDVEKMIAILVQKQPYISETLWTQILNVIPSSEVGKMVARLVQKNPIISDELCLRVLDMLEQSSPDAISQSEMGEILEQLIQKTVLFHSNNLLNSRVLDVLQSKPNRLSGDWLGKILERFIRNIGSPNLKELPSQVLDVLESNKNVIPDDEMGEIVGRLIQNIGSFRWRTFGSPTFSATEPQLRVLDVLENKLNVIAGSEMLRTVDNFVKNIWYFKSQTLQSQFLNVLKSKRDQIPDSEMGSIVEILALNIDSFTDTVKPSILLLIQNNIGCVSEQVVWKVLQKFASSLRYLDANDQHQAVQLLKSYCADYSRSSTSQEYVYCKQVVDAKASATTDVNASATIDVNVSTATDAHASATIDTNAFTTTDVSASATIDANVSTATDAHASATIDTNAFTTTDVNASATTGVNTSTTASANISFFRKTLLRISSSFQNAWKWFLERIPSAFRVHIF